MLAGGDVGAAQEAVHRPRAGARVVDIVAVDADGKTFERRPPRLDHVAEVDEPFDCAIFHKATIPIPIQTIFNPATG